MIIGWIRIDGSCALSLLAVATRLEGLSCRSCEPEQDDGRRTAGDRRGTRLVAGVAPEGQLVGVFAAVEDGVAATPASGLDTEGNLAGDGVLEGGRVGLPGPEQVFDLAG
jgi:hypothetical protein